ncbi:MAG: ABC transporter ATP-binding protein, partial [Desulfurococcaceae archaeon]
MSFMELRNIYFYYTKDKPVLKELNLKVERGELLALLGESGSGKSTLLKIIAGFLRPSSGRVLIDGKDFTEVPPHKRDVGIVFQNYALFPHMSVFENIMYGLKVRGISRDEANERVNELL